MAASRERKVMWAAVLLAVMLGAGCNVLSVPYFIFGPESKRDAELKQIASEEKDKEVRVVILTYPGLETRPEFLRVDRELSSTLANWLKQGFEYNKERVTVVSPRQVEKFKDDNPNWHTLSLHEVGKHFDADQVIYLEINSIGLYEPGSGNQLYRGRVNISVAVADVSKPDDDPVTKEFSCQFPGEARGPIPVGDSAAHEFRKSFLNYAAKRLSWYFTAHPTNTEYHCE